MIVRLAGIAILTLSAALGAQEIRVERCPPYPPAKRGGPIPTLLACQVTEQARWTIGTQRPIYPELMADNHIEGMVMMEFVISERGTVDSSSIRIFQSTHDLFTDAAIRVLLRGVATGAKVYDLSVPQVVRHTFIFADTGSACAAARQGSDPAKTVICNGSG